jgi:hypothetical protein
MASSWCLIIQQRLKDLMMADLATDAYFPSHHPQIKLSAVAMEASSGL